MTKFVLCNIKKISHPTSFCGSFSIWWSGYLKKENATLNLSGKGRKTSVKNRKPQCHFYVFVQISHLSKDDFEYSKQLTSLISWVLVIYVYVIVSEIKHS